MPNEFNNKSHWYNISDTFHDVIQLSVLHLRDVNSAEQRNRLLRHTQVNTLYVRALPRMSDKVPTNKIYRRASSEQRLRTRSCHESERLV